ncbi:MAG: MmcQ/YjbR family DNA-binding protein [Myxococcales bacterium]|nr:MmcQ/YjbR family DNA-binding protein [Myxococcales bacterium]
MNKLTISAAKLKRLRALCLALPEATEQEAWGDPTFRVRGKIFAMQKGNFEGGRPSLWIKAALGVQEMLTSSRPEEYFVPPYVGHKGWVGLYLDVDSIDWELASELVTESHRLVGPKKLGAAKAAPRKAKPKPASARR